MEAVEIQKMTVTEFHQLEFDHNDTFLYELIDGKLVSRRANSPRHQQVLGSLLAVIHSITKAIKSGELLLGPIDVFLDDTNSPQPDLVFISLSKAHIVTDDGVMGAPTMVVEVISPSSIYRDRVTKKALYERFGVQEYWLVDPADNFIEIYALTDGQYKLLSAASLEEGQLVSDVLPGFVLDLNALFGEH